MLSAGKMTDYKRAHSPETNGNAGALVKKQKTDDGAIVTSTKQNKEQVNITLNSSSLCTSPAEFAPVYYHSS